MDYSKAVMLAAGISSLEKVNIFLCDNGKTDIYFCRKNNFLFI